jgi:uncharacterized protein (TIGR03437 family)
MLSSPAPVAARVLVALLTAALSMPLLSAQQNPAAGLIASPSSLDIPYQFGGFVLPLSVDLGAPTLQAFTVRVATSSGNWLRVNPTSGTTPQRLQVDLTPNAASFLRPGINSATIIVTNATNGAALSIPVTLTASGNPITASPSSLTFTRPAGSPDPASASLFLNSPYATGITSLTVVPWLSVTPRDQSIPGAITVTASAAQLAPGVYTADIAMSSFPSVFFRVPVTFTVTPPGPVFSVPNLAFRQTAGDAPPAPQTLELTSEGGPFRFTLTTADGGRNWLSATANSTTTPARITVNAAPAGLPVGTYRGTISVTPSAGTPRALDAVLTITAPPPPSISALIHGATLRDAAVSPGLIFSLFGTGLGLPNGQAATVTSAGHLPTTLDGVRVLFDGIPAPLLYVRGDQINGIVPYAVAAKPSTQLRVESKGTLSAGRDLPVAESAPGLFTLSATGTGQAAALNQDGTGNGPSNPEQAGRALVLYGTGEGLLDTPTEDGLITGATLRRPLLPVAATVGGVPVEVLYAGSAPGMAAGVLQINLLLNERIPKGSAVPVEIRIGNTPTAAGVTVSVR